MELSGYSQLENCQGSMNSQIVYGPRRHADTVPFLNKDVVAATGATPSVQVEGEPYGPDLAETLVAPNAAESKSARSMIVTDSENRIFIF